MGTFIDGVLSDGEGATIQLVDPATGERGGTIAQASLGDVSRAVASARAAYPAWAAQTPGERAQILTAVADALAAAGDLVDLEDEDTRLGLHLALRARRLSA